MAFGTIAQAIDVIVRHRPGISQRELHEALQADVRKDCNWLVEKGHILLNEDKGHAAYYPRTGLKPSS